MSLHRRCSRAWLLAVASLLVASLSVTPVPARALGRDLHKCIANSAHNAWSFPRLDVKIDTVKQGARHEDEEDHIWDHYCVGIICYTTCTHFWEPDGPLDATTMYDSNSATYCGNAWMKANELLDASIATYFMARDPQWEPIKDYLDDVAWELLGHITHLIGDMSVPAHVHVDLHPTNDSYDDIWAGSDGVYNTYCAEDGPNTPGLPNLADFGGLVDIPQGAVDGVLNSGDPGFGLPPGENGRILYAKLFYLMYTTAQRADVFASDDYGGDTDDWAGWMNGFAPTCDPSWGARNAPHCYPGFAATPRTLEQIDDNWTWVGNEITADDWDGDWSRIAEASFLQSMRAVATFYQAFRDAIDATPPVTTATPSYAYPPTETGWTRGGVSVSVAATDEHSGVYQTWTQDTCCESSPSVLPMPPLVGLTSDGVHDLHYWSEDWFGNLEPQHELQVKIDQTDPVIEWTSPQEHGFYLTNATLTIDWHATDGTSGVASEVATLDGAAVVKGQMFDLALLAGPHEFALEVTDVAGNTTSTSFDFTVAIAATADVKPDRVNAKSAGDPITAYVEFPAPYDVSQIALPTVGVWYEGGGATASEVPTDLVDLDHDRLPERMARVSKAALLQILGEGGLPSGLPLQPVEVIVQGALLDGTRFYAVETIEIAHF